MAVSTTWVVIACIVLGGLIWFSFFHFYDVGFGELIVRKNKKSSGSGVLYRRDFVRTDIIKPTNIEFLKSNPRSYIPRNETVLKVSEVVKLYDDEENKLSEAAIVWAEFILIPKVRLRSRQQSLDPSVLNTFHLCSNEVVANLSRKLDGKDFEFCKWSNSRTGGKVKIGESFGLLSSQEQAKFHELGCSNVVDDKTFSCDDERGDNLIQTWRRNLVKGLCEKNAESKVNCFDSQGGSRYCQFENAMMNFKRMRQKIRADGTPSRSWEQGFLSSSCGEKGKENIGYSKIYKPDIDGSSDAVCDYVFNETVVAYSHDNVKAFSHMFSDYLNVQSLLWLSNAAAYSKDVSLLNIDSFRMQQYYGDEPNEYFSYYTKTFRRILKAKDFGTAKVCFKNLIMQPKPEIQFTRDGWRNDLRCSLIGPSSIYQRWNLQMRDNFGLLSQSALQTNEIFTILLVTKASKLGSRKQTKERKKKKNKEKSSNFSSLRATRSLSNLESSVDKSPSAKGIGNSDELMIMLKELTGEFSARKHDVTFQIVKQDLDLLAFDDQVALIARSSLIIGMHGTGIAISMHMAVGSTYCCGVIEIFPIENDEKVRGIGGREGSDRDNVSSTSRKLLGKESKGDLNFISLKGHGNMARRMGHKYSRIDLKSVEADGVVLRATNGVSEGRRKHSVSSVNGTLSDQSRQSKHKSRDVLLDSSREDANSKTSSRSAMRRLDPKVGAIEMTDGIRKKSSLASSRSTGGGGTYVPPTILRQSVSLMIESILIKPSCFLPAVIKKNI